MKKNSLKVSTFVLLLCGAFFSCTQDEVVNEKVNASADNFIQLVVITDNNEIIPVSETRNETAFNPSYALKFASERDYQETLQRIKGMSMEERLAFADSLGLTSLSKLLTIADDELAEIDSLATSEADFKTKYKEYQKKYSKYFVFNDVDLEDASPYIPNGDEYASYLVGINHSVVIGDKVNKIVYSDQMSPMDKALFANVKKNDGEKLSTRALATTDESTWEVNSFTDAYHADGNDYKMSFAISQQGADEVYVRLASQKKGAFAWRRPKNQVFYLKVDLSNFSYDIAGPLLPPSIFEYSAKGGKIEFKFGRFIGSRITGKAYLWTEHTVSKINGTVIYEYVDGKRVPQCLISKAHACSVNLPKN